VAPYFQTGTINTMPQESFPTGGLPLLTANNLGYPWVQPDPKRSYVEPWNLSVQRQLAGGAGLRATCRLMRPDRRR
jgi:hypothetical protein